MDTVDKLFQKGAKHAICPGCGKRFVAGMSMLGHVRWCPAYNKLHPISQKAARRLRKGAALGPPGPEVRPVEARPEGGDGGSSAQPPAQPPAGLSAPPSVEIPAPVVAAPAPGGAPASKVEPMHIHIEVPKEGSQEPLKPLPEFLGEAPPAAEKKEYMDKAEMANLIEGLGQLYNVQVNKMMTGEARDPRELIRWTKEDTEVVVNSVWPVVKKYGWDSEAFFALLLKYGPEIGCVLGIGMLVLVKLQAMLAIRKAQKEGGRQESIGGPETSPGRGAAPTSEEEYINRAWRDATGHIGR